MNDAPRGPARRPRSLTVICILSFAYGALILVNGYMSAFTDFPRENLERAKLTYRDLVEQMGPEASAKSPAAMLVARTISFDEKVVQHAKPLGYSWLALSVLTIASVWLMWMLKRMGFWIYLLAAAGGVAVKFAYLGSDSLLGSVNSILGIIFAITFVVLYALHLKHMR